ncbi:MULTISPECIES: HsmA family protein [unclassified Fusibacter]|uniref:HsmA family protein n=1 Tax=unclassified Fusibacter TaxID=2624464 RepID=UPI0010118B32|nr:MULTISPECIES: HsmA family protein [unclassified Fusibacter]MCK8061197.1 TIGR03987 family protein [Fusibacter sp. A2]NPE23266.1 TIGR03987 family protein [Fusibacter sp. A1]RXV59310.1 TIGR03987 family protein [Fusibacter sp. A1]
MSLPLITAIITISLALVFYTIGVWSEHKEKKLTLKHLIFFILGLIFDTTGTTIMSSIAGNSDAVHTGLNWHAITGGFAIGLMAFHAIWAIIVLVKKNDKAQINFHKFSLVVWLLWLIPYVSGAIIAMK